MASLEELIYNKITGSPIIKQQLASFLNAPAFFERMAPDDKDAGWNGKQYPRINYILDRAEDPERKISGMVVLEIWCLNNPDELPEVIEAEIRNLIDGAVFHPTGESVTAIKWNRSEPWDQKTRMNERDELIIGITMAFDMLAFPSQTTAEPDPIAAINKWTNSNFSNLQVDPTTWAPTDTAPAIYWRVAGVSLARQTNSVTWFDVQLAGHIISMAPSVRLQLVKQITEAIAVANRIYMLDNSPMFIQRVTADSTGDPFREGQLKITVQYGVLYKKPDAPILEHINTSGGFPNT